MKTSIILFCSLILLTGCQPPSEKEVILSQCETHYDQQIDKNFCYKNTAYELKDKSVCERIVEDFSNLSKFEKENMDANVSMKIDCYKGVDLATDPYLENFDSTNNKLKSLRAESKKIYYVPQEMKQKGYSYFVESVTNENKTYTYTIYSDHKTDYSDTGNGYCDSGYLNESAPIYCLLQVKDSTDQVIFELESNEFAEFEINGEKFVAPYKWYDNESLLIVSGVGDGGISFSNGKALNIQTKKFNQLYETEYWGGIGQLFIFNGEVFWFNFPSLRPTGGEKDFAELYKVDNTVDSLEDLCIDDIYICSEIDFSKTTKINELRNVRSIGYELDKGIVVRLNKDNYDYDQDPDYIYDIETNSFLPYK